MTRNLKELLASDDVILGTWSQIAAPEMIDLIGLNGFEFTIIDCQHGPFGLQTADTLARAADANDIACAVRLAENDPVTIMKALDAGIRHVVIPNLETAEQAALAVSATQFGPHGLRGACPCCRSGGHFIRNWRDYVAQEEARVGAIALVETHKGVENIEAIAQTPGLAALMFGPFDLSVSLGLEGDWRHPRVRDSLNRMLDAAQKAKVPVMMPVFSTNKSECVELVSGWADKGVTNFIIGSDKIIVADAFLDWSERLR